MIAEKISQFTRSQIQILIKNKNITLNNNFIKKNQVVKTGDIIKIKIPMPSKTSIEPENISIDLVYEDNDLLIVNKPKGMVVHPAPGNYHGTLVNGLLFLLKDSLSGINGIIRPGIVHRIDKNTSGLLIIAKNDFAHKNLAKQIKEHSFSREYEAVVYGEIKTSQGLIDAPIGRNPKDRKKMAITEKNSRKAITYYKVITEYENFSHLRFKLKTGRTHQIRVHMAYIGHPIVGDDVYGPKKVVKELNGQCLHAKFIGFIHPRTGKYMEFESVLPDYFKKFLRSL